MNNAAQKIAVFEEQTMTNKCYFDDHSAASICEGALWQCQSCLTWFCQKHSHATSKGSNVECGECERKRKEAEAVAKAGMHTIVVTRAFLALVGALHAARTMFINESTLSDALGTETPKDYWSRCEDLFFRKFVNEVRRLGLSNNKQTFEAIMRLNVPEEINGTPFAELPKKFAFDPWAGMGYGGIVPVTEEKQCPERIKELADADYTPKFISTSTPRL